MKAELLWQWQLLGFASSGGVECGLSVLAYSGTVRWVGNQGGGLRWARRWAFGWGWSVSCGRCFSFCLVRHSNRWALFRLAAPLLTRGGAVPHLSFDAIVLHHFSLATGDHLTCCCTKPVLRQWNTLLVISEPLEKEQEREFDCRTFLLWLQGCARQEVYQCLLFHRGEWNKVKWNSQVLCWQTYLWVRLADVVLHTTLWAKLLLTDQTSVLP